MRALFQVTIGLDIDDHEEAARIVMLMDKSIELNVLSAIEQSGASIAQVGEVCDWYGTNVIFPRSLEVEESGV